MHKQMPEWLKRNYNALWKKHKKEAFTFKQVRDELGISREMTVKTLWELEQRGFIVKQRSETDYRARIYRLISPEDIKFVMNLYSLEEPRIESITDKLVFVNDKIPYAITGSYAAYHYHHYMNPPSVIEIKIQLQDEGKWIAFLTDKKTRVFTSNVIETRKVKNYVKLTGSKWAIDYIRTQTKDGYYIEKPEFLIIELLERQSQTSIIEAVAIITTNKNYIAWENLLKYANSRRLGCLLDIMNFEAYRPVIKPEIIEKIKKRVSGKTDEEFPKDQIFLSRLRELENKLAHHTLLTEGEKLEFERAKRYFEAYEELSRKWGIFIILPRNVIRKVLEDLGVKLGKK